MRHSSHFLLREICGVPYLMPWGQPIADQRRGMKLNKTSAWLWRLLDTERTWEELFSLFCSRYAAAPEDMPLLENDLSCFLSTLQLYGMLENCASVPAVQNTFSSAASMEFPCCYLHIGGLTLNIIGPKDIIPAYFSPFRQESVETVHQTIRLLVSPPSSRMGGKLLLQNRDMIIYDADQWYLLLFPSMGHVQELRISKDASCAELYYTPPRTDALREEVFHAIRPAFLYLAQKHHMTVLHSASVIYRDMAWLFSGSSGTGKSTHTNLWHELLHVPLINGDLNLLTMEEGEPAIHGLPWCGTSGICVRGTYPLGGIILLKQAQTDYMEALSPDARQLLVFQRLISPLWTPEQLDCSLRFVAELAGHIYIARLHCTKNPSAVKTARKEIDNYLDTL